MPESFRIAIIGAGGISNAHIAAVKASGGRLTIAAVIDPSEPARTKVAQETGAVTFDTPEAFFKSHAKQHLADGVVVCTPPSVRVQIVQGALKAGLHVLSEKPLAHTVADAKKIASLGKKHKKLITRVGYCHRFAPAVNAMKDLTASGKIGALVRVENFFACDLPGHETKWFSEPKKSGGGAVLDMGSHSIDLFHYLAGPSKVVGSVFANKWKGRTETAGTILLKATKPAKGTSVAGMIVSGWAETCRFTLALVGTGGMLSYDYEKPNEIVFKDLGGKAESISVESHDVRFTRQLVAFADACQSKAKNALATFDDGLAAALANEAAAKLARK